MNGHASDRIPLDSPRLVYQALLLAWNARDAAAMAACFESDGSMIGFDGSQVESRASIEAHLAPIFADHPTAAYVAVVREVRKLRAEVTLVRAVAGMVPPGASDIEPALNTVHTLVATRSAGQKTAQWHAALFQSTPAAWHGRPDDTAALTAELTEVLRSGRVCV